MSTRRSTVSISSDSVRPYLAQIGKIPLINAAQEVDLATKIQAGMEAEERMEQIEAEGIELTPLERRRITRVIAIGLDAKDRLTEANLRLVVKNAKVFTGSGLPLPDLIQAGNIGLMRAVEKFDHTRGFKFSTYATHWIRQGITRAIADQGRTIRIPVHLNEQVNRLRKVRKELTMELGREPEIPEIAAVLEVTPERVHELMRVGQDLVSLETPIGEDGDSSLGDFLPDTSVASPAEEAEAEAMRAELEDVLAGLTERERQVLELRFGLLDDKPRTLEEVGREFGVTRERIRQIENKTLAKLRTSRRVGLLRDYLA